MKKSFLAMLTAGLGLVAGPASAQTTLSAWTFDNLSLGNNPNPAVTTGFGSAAVFGLGGGSNPEVISLGGSSAGTGNAWRVRATGATTGWSSVAPIASQGAKFGASTAGFYKVKLTFDVYATPDAEANLLVQYTTEGAIWHNAPITSAGTLAAIVTNTVTNSTVLGTYVALTNNGTTGWNNQITVDLGGVSGVDNNANFAFRIVNASTGTNCLDTTGAPYNNTSGYWVVDNVAVQGRAIDTIAAWTFESYGTTTYVPHPAPEFGSGTASSLGFNTAYTFADGSVGSTNAPDTLVQAGSSTPTGTTCWRLRGQGPGNGWNTQSPIGSQGAEFDVNTVNYNDVILSFDLYFTTQAEAKMQVEYTLDGVTWLNAPNLYYGANPTFVLTNAVADPNYSPDTVTGTYFFQTTGQNWYNNLIVDFTGVAGVANNPNFGVRIVNAAQNGDCVAFNNGSYNNSSGNCRLDNVTVGGSFIGSLPPTLNYDATATVDGPFTNAFLDDPAWRANITAVLVNGSALTNSAYTTTQAGQIVFTPAKSILLQSSGTKSIVIYANGYSSAKVTQPIAAGLAKKLTVVTQPLAPTASGGTLVANPTLSIVDQYGNGTLNPYTNAIVTATVGGAGGWSLSGSNVQSFINGVAVFTNLAATVNGSSAVTGATLNFAITGYTNTTTAGTTTNFVSSTFTIGAPPAPFTRGNLAVIQLDTVANNTTFSVIEVKSSTLGQTAPANIIPISATASNSLRLCSAGSCGKLSLSDDGTLISFVGFSDNSSATLDETLVLNRAVGTLNYTNQFNTPLNYTSISLGGSQGRACCSLDNNNWIVADKGGLYVNDFLWSVQNNVVVRTFGGIPYVETQKTANGSPIPAVYSLTMMDAGDIAFANPNNLGTDPVASDFYLVSSNILYILDAVSSAQGIIKKFSWVPDGSQPSGFAWTANGSFTNGTGGDSLFVATNGSGGAYLYYTTAASSKNSIIRLTDAAGYNANMSIVSSNVVYTAPGNTYVKGLTFVPQQTPYATELTPTPFLLAQNNATTNSVFSVTNVPDDAAWRAAITGILVNGTALPPAAYNLTAAGKITFDPSQSTLLSTAGSKTITFVATGYVTNALTQLLVGAPAKLAITTQPAAPKYDGGPLATNPVVVVQDGLGNLVPSSATITASVGAGSWVLGGVTNKNASAGTAAFGSMTAFGNAAVTGATITFTANGLASVTSSTFNLPAPAVASLNGVVVPGGKLAFGFTNYPGLSFTVLGTNNLAAPKATWPVIGGAVENANTPGTYRFTNSTPTTNGAMYYLLRQP